MSPIPEIFKHNYWIRNCDNIKYSADVLIEKLTELHDDNIPFESLREHHGRIQGLLEANFLLLGYAIENILKGYSIFIFTTNKNLPSNADFDFLSKNVWQVKNGHDLLKLAEKSGLTLTTQEIEVFEKLYRHIMWKGRYHIPKSNQKIEDSIKTGISEEYLVDDRKIVNEFIIKVKSLMTNNS